MQPVVARIGHRSYGPGLPFSLQKGLDGLGLGVPIPSRTRVDRVQNCRDY